MNRLETCMKICESKNVRNISEKTKKYIISRTHLNIYEKNMKRIPNVRKHMKIFKNQKMLKT
jgi:hypothetical protein